MQDCLIDLGINFVEEVGPFKGSTLASVLVT